MITRKYGKAFHLTVFLGSLVKILNLMFQTESEFLSYEASLTIKLKPIWICLELLLTQSSK